ncbi:MAG: Rieske (2Fe-2S) protein [Acidobacteriota bacterium]
MKEKRRNFLEILTKGFITLWSMGIIWILFSYIKPPKRKFEENLIKIEDISTIPINGSSIYHYKDKSVILIRKDEREFLAFSAICTHLRCILNYQKERELLICPCHAGIFDFNGNVISGPPTKSLMKYRVDIRGSRLYIYFD